MCSSLLGLGGTHVQQCSECRICVPHSRSFKRNSIAASYQHHAGLQPANLVTAQHVLRSRRKLLLFVIFTFRTFLGGKRTFEADFLNFPPTSTFRTVRVRTGPPGPPFLSLSLPVRVHVVNCCCCCPDSFYFS